MKRMVLLVLCSLAVLAAPSRAASPNDIFLLGFTGFDYENPDPLPSTYLALGEGYKAVGLVTSVGPLLVPDYDTDLYEYTFYLFNLTVNARTFDVPSQTLVVGFGDNGRARYYEDFVVGGTPHNYGVNPPNATAPSTFTDGTLVLGGDVDQFALFYDFIANQGFYSGQMTQDEGLFFDLGYVNPVGGWTLGGLLGRRNRSIPTGYDNQISGECVLRQPDPAAHATWGAIKKMYR